MEITKTFYAKNRQEWRRWLAKNYKLEPEIWLVYYKKATGKPRVEYNDAVEEALCFGWIDGQTKGIDAEKYAQRFTPRRAKSSYSVINKERLRKLIDAGLVIPEVHENVKDILAEEVEIAPDILKAIQANAEAWKNFQQFSDRYKRIRIGFIEGARNRPAEFSKHLNYFIKMTAQNKQFGFGIEDYY